MPGIGISPSKLVRQGTLLNPPAILRDGNTVAWYDYKDLSTITKDGSNFVSRWNDKLGSGHDLIQATGAYQPSWTPGGIYFDSVTHFLKTSAFTYNQPEMVYLVLSQHSWSSAAVIMDGNAGNFGTLYQWSASPNIMAFAGGDIVLNPNLELEQFAIVRILFDGENSKLVVNKTPPITGNFGSANMGGISFGGAANYTYLSNITIKDAVFRKIADEPTNEAAIYNYLKSKNGTA